MAWLNSGFESPWLHFQTPIFSGFFHGKNIILPEFLPWIGLVFAESSRGILGSFPIEWQGWLFELTIDGRPIDPKAK